MAKWLVVPSLTYTMDYNIYTDYKESYGNDTIYSINILTSVLHSKEAAEKALIYTYFVQGTDDYGFQATLNNNQASSLLANPHVYSIEGAHISTPVNKKLYLIYTEKPNKDPFTYYTEILKPTLRSEETAKKAIVFYNSTGSFTALLSPGATYYFCEHYVCCPGTMLYTKT